MFMLDVSCCIPAAVLVLSAVAPVVLVVLALAPNAHCVENGSIIVDSLSSAAVHPVGITTVSSRSGWSVYYSGCCFAGSVISSMTTVGSSASSDAIGSGVSAVGWPSTGTGVGSVLSVSISHTVDLVFDCFVRAVGAAIL